jgi:hypothetical protein
MKSFIVKATLNKKNGQINFSLPKKKLSDSFKKNILDTKQLKIIIEDMKNGNS